MIVIGWALVVTSVMIFAWECLHWLHDGTWRTISLAKMIHLPVSDHGADRQWSSIEFLRSTCHWIGRMPAVAMLFIGGLVCSWRANDIHTYEEAQVARVRPAVR